ncbi:hypothetical protein BE17_43990 [Sorangium cellulosum]|uniref:Uncharacterized protein n=1 Tax=Sorangium cellulosum TaxID=56 RepID=A0A150SJ34_SORCE|nr:hypothetical protein BE17_43990 [Sorangium cellulosum]
MRRYVSLFLLALLTFAVRDDDASVRGHARLESVGPGAGAIEAPYTGAVGAPGGSGRWEEDEQLDRWFARESVVVINGQIVDQEEEEILARRLAARREAARTDLPARLSRAVGETIRGVKVLAFKMSDWARGARCEGQRFVSPPRAPAGGCQDGTEDCDGAPPR